MLKNIIIIIFIFYSLVAYAERNIQTSNVGFVNCIKTVSKWDEYNRGNWSNGKTWSFNTKYALEQKKLDVTATFVADPKIFYKLSCNGDMLTIDVP